MDKVIYVLILSGGQWEDSWEEVVLSSFEKSKLEEYIEKESKEYIENKKLQDAVDAVVQKIYKLKVEFDDKYPKQIFQTLLPEYRNISNEELKKMANLTGDRYEDLRSKRSSQQIDYALAGEERGRETKEYNRIKYAKWLEAREELLLNLSIQKEDFPYYNGEKRYCGEEPNYRIEEIEVI